MVSVYLRLILVEGCFWTHPQRMRPVWPSAEGLIRENLIYHQLKDDILLRQFNTGSFGERVEFAFGDPGFESFSD